MLYSEEKVAIAHCYLLLPVVLRIQLNYLYRSRSTKSLFEGTKIYVYRNVRRRQVGETELESNRVNYMDTPRETGDSNCIKVAVRVRPFNSTEKANGEVSCVTIHKDKIVLANLNNSSEDQSFAFDLIFDQTSQQISVWSAIGDPILTKAFQGYNGTIFAYGQTGSGMSHYYFPF